MKFSVSKDVFEKMNNVCFGVILAKGINNDDSMEIAELLKSSIESIEIKFQDKKVKEVEEIVYYRDSFTKLGINPNKFMSSIEAMTTRVAKKKGLPNINSIVDIGNAVSLKYLVPLGAHDIDIAEDDICVRF
jgi:DNA/RNA-binding domain of Phe-tRNA-synthetase-like protein